jgi:hypothetical protein
MNLTTGAGSPDFGCFGPKGEVPPRPDFQVVILIDREREAQLVEPLEVLAGR